MIGITNSGIKILCDGDDCHAAADAPVALHTVLSNSLPGVQPIDGWLFIANVGGDWRHYCPDCQKLYLKNLRAPSVK